MKLRKPLLSFLALLLGLVGFLPFGAAPLPSALAQEESQVLNVYNWGVYMDIGDEDGEKDMNAAFEEWYLQEFSQPITVNYTTYENNESMYQKLVAGGAEYDIVIPSDYMVSRMIQQGMLEKLDFANIPNYQNVSEEFKGDAWQYDPTHEYSVPYMWGYVGLVYNTNHVSGNLAAWDVLWDQQYAGKILMMNNPRDTFAIALAKNGFSLNTHEPDHWQIAYNDLQTQKPLVQGYVTDEIFDKMQNGEAYLAPCYYGDYLIMKENEAPGVSLAFSPVTTQTANKYVDAMCIPVGCQNKLAAERYINFMCSYEPGIYNANYTGYSSPLDNVKNNQGELEYYYQEDELTYPDASLLSRYEEFHYLGERVQAIMDNHWKGLKKSEAGPWMYVALAGIVLIAIFALVYRKQKEKRVELLRQKAREKYMKLNPKI